ncbi:MAG TPA: CPXCG motif-containing cysteine-rich protein [Bacteroidota bacterium]|jgi:hypothetical protein|nr:CPXCG motif-containing cysteine-rich protein [Bacteroidota bacterium]
MDELKPTSYQCAYCGEQNETMVDPGGGDRQNYIEDCAVCCRPNVLYVSISVEGEIVIRAEFEE